MFKTLIILFFVSFTNGYDRISRSSGTLVDFTDPKVQGHLDALVRMAQSCVIKVRATPKDVRAYFTNSSPVSRTGQCFAACMLEQSDVIHHGKDRGTEKAQTVHLCSTSSGTCICVYASPFMKRIYEASKIYDIPRPTLRDKRNNKYLNEHCGKQTVLMNEVLTYLVTDTDNIF